MTIGPGSLINGKYRLGRQLGEGGMGAIYEARHEFLGTEVALKFLHPALSSRPHVVARFVQEARVSANIRSPHVVSVIDVDQSPEGLAFLVMELLHGEPLSARLAREPILPLPTVVAISLQVLLALEVAHGLGVVHRDMKPENVFLTDAPGNIAANSVGLLVKILDFGIAKLRTLGEVRAQLTRPGVVMGTPEYMSPEQVFAADAVDARADLYALGAMMFEMLAGRRPVQADDARTIANAVMAGQTPRLESVAPGVPSSIADVIAIALSAKPNDRFTSATAMRQALVHAAREANLNIDAPQAALRSRAALPIADASGQVGVLGGVGLGVAPQAMLGPGNPAAIAAFDANAYQHKPPPPVVESPRIESVPKLPIHPTNGSAAPEPILNEGSGTLAAMPSPYAPPYAAHLEPVPPPNNFGSTMMAASPGGTDAGFVSPFATDRSFRADQVPDLGAAVSGEQPMTSEAPSRRRGVPWIPIVLGVVGVAAIIGAVVWATQGPPAAPPPPTAATSAEPEEEETPKKKKPKVESTTTAAPTPTVPVTTPPPATTGKPVPKPSVKPSVSTSVSAPPSVSVPKPPTSVSTVPPDIIQLPPLPWPPP